MLSHVKFPFTITHDELFLLEVCLCFRAPKHVLISLVLVVRLIILSNTMYFYQKSQ